MTLRAPTVAELRAATIATQAASSKLSAALVSLERARAILGEAHEADSQHHERTHHHGKWIRTARAYEYTSRVVPAKHRGELRDAR